MTVLCLAPSILIMATSFTRIVVVLSLLRTAIGLQQTPPNSVIISLSLFLTAIVMGPTLQKSYDDGIKPLLASRSTARRRSTRPARRCKAFMLRQCATTSPCSSSSQGAGAGQADDMPLGS